MFSLTLYGNVKWRKIKMERGQAVAGLVGRDATRSLSHVIVTTWARAWRFVQSHNNI